MCYPFWGEASHKPATFNLWYLAFRSLGSQVFFRYANNFRLILTGLVQKLH